MLVITKNIDAFVLFYECLTHQQRPKGTHTMTTAKFDLSKQSDITNFNEFVKNSIRDELSYILEGNAAATSEDIADHFELSASSHDQEDTGYWGLGEGVTTLTTDPIQERRMFVSIGAELLMEKLVEDATLCRAEDGNLYVILRAGNLETAIEGVERVLAEEEEGGIRLDQFSHETGGGMWHMYYCLPGSAASLELVAAA